jgi:hypothetical protein
MVTVLVSACISGPVCSRPYTLVGGVCCLDEDGDGICDRDKPLATTTIQTTSTTQSTTTTTRVFRTTTTTTLWNPEAECLSVSDCVKHEDIICDDLGREVHVHYTPTLCSKNKCVYRSSREISAYPCGSWQRCVDGLGCVRQPSTTTTTVEVVYSYDYTGILARVAKRAQASTSTTSTTLLSCFDSDGGRKYNVKSGNVSGYYAYNKTCLTDTQESCINVRSLTEYYCESGILESIRHDCPSHCIDGRCCGGEGNTCNGDRDCCSGVCKAVGVLKYCL